MVVNSCRKFDEDRSVGFGIGHEDLITRIEFLNCEFKRNGESDFCYFLRKIIGLKHLRIPISDLFMYRDKRATVRFRYEVDGELISEVIKESLNNWEVTVYLTRIKVENYQNYYWEVEKKILGIQ